MGEHEDWAQPSGLQPNGLLPNAGPVTQVLDSERWLKAEEKTAELIACIKPSPQSEVRRNAVADYVQRLIKKCFPCQVFTFGSVPLKTYLPDGDIDLTAFSNNQSLKDTWANHVRDMLESEEKNENAEFHVKEVQYIQAEVKIIKCLVENIVVDISFNQLGGLCTLCFLEEVDHLINQNHLLKRSIILIKAWCYYESRILGAHHGLISTYALETLILYIFHVFNNSFTGPLEVLYRFLEFFSNFDWDNFCVSLWGPVPITSLPDVTAEPPRKDSGELLLSKLFLDACSSVYAVFPVGQENQGQHFVSKHFNVIDPLRVNNNLGRSVGKGNFFRIRSAFAFGAKRLEKLLDCPKENLVYEVNQFFMNTWDRHGSGNRSDAPRTDLWSLRLSTPDHLHGPENLKNNTSAKNLNENSSDREVEVEGTRSRNISSQHGNYSLEGTSRPTHSSAATRSQNHKTYGNVNCSGIQDPAVQEVSPNSDVHFDKGERSIRSDHLVNGIQGRFLFARTRSSPELTDTYSNLSSRGMRNETPGSSKTQSTSARQDNNRRNNPGSERLVNHNVSSSTGYLSSGRHMPLDQSLDATVDSNSGLNIYHRDSGSPVIVEDFSSVSGTQGMLQEEQDHVNMMSSTMVHSNFFRIRSAFAFGAKRLEKLLDCPKENLVYEVNQFFMNTWDRHGSGNRSDAPRTDLWSLRLSTPDHLHGPENLKNNTSAKNLNENSSDREVEVEGTRSRNISSQHGNYSLEGTSRPTHSSAATRSQNHKTYGNVNCSGIQDPAVQEVSPNSDVHFDKGERSIRSDHLVNGIQGRFLFARTRSSPELTDTYSNLSSRGMRNETPGSSKTQSTSARQDNNRRNNPGSERLVNHNVSSSTGYLSSGRHMPLDQSLDATVDSNSGLNIYHRDSGSPVIVEDFSSVSGTQGMLQEEQDHVNMMSSTMVHSHNGRVPMPLNLSSAHPPLPMPPSILASMEYAQRNFAGMIPPNSPLIDTTFSNMQFLHGLVSQQLTHYFPGIGLTPNLDETIEPGNEIFGSTEMNPGEIDHDFWQEQDAGSTGGFEPESRNYKILHSDDKPQSSSVSLNFVPSSRLSGSGNSMRVQQKFTRENRQSIRKDHQDRFPYQDNRGNDIYFDDRSTSSRFSSVTHSSSLRSKTSSESSWDGSSAKVSQSIRGKRGKKTVHAEPSPVYGKSKNVSEHTTHAEEDERDWNQLSTMSNGMAERSSGPQPVGSLHGLRQHTPGYELAQISRSDSMIPMAPVLLGPGSRQRVMDNSGDVPLTFYATGPPVPFLTMLPFYNVPPETGTSDASTSHFGGEEGVDSSESGQNFDSSEGLVPSEELNIPNISKRTDFAETSDEHKSDILNSDFASHSPNLQYGRFCQSPQSHGPLIYSSPVDVPPGYLQGRVPWDGPGRPLSANMNLFTQLMGYGPRLVPVAPLQSLPNRPPNVYQHYVDEIPRYRSGTGTYLLNPKVSVRDRNSSGAKRGNYNYVRSDNHDDREGNWNIKSKSRASGRNHNRNQSEKSNSRLDPLATSDNRAESSWSSYKHDSVSSYQSQNGPLCSNSSQGAPSNVAYGMYPLPVMNPSGASSNGPSAPSVVMLYPFDHNASYSSHAEQLDFGSLGPVGFSGMNEPPQLSEGRQAKEQRFHRSSMQRSSADQPSSPHFQRRV
ncbi:Poly(A) RNA polymerase [Actinidia chinensis var. chinensis]|uniref:Poly(A) RNA polymerase n=1 Tax=Actinidia chinensis var. chinensis TaxID=1590841 RepID=A0A2R6Q7T4_ACTCC|nr:Poly(A) RNA polymerase [Actinidia chinensis var. chinensis]